MLAATVATVAKQCKAVVNRILAKDVEVFDDLNFCGVDKHLCTCVVSSNVIDPERHKCRIDCILDSIMSDTMST